MEQAACRSEERIETEILAQRHLNEEAKSPKCEMAALWERSKDAKLCILKILLCILDVLNCPVCIHIGSKRLIFFFDIFFFPRKIP